MYSDMYIADNKLQWQCETFTFQNKDHLSRYEDLFESEATILSL